MQLGPRQHQSKLPAPKAAVDHLHRVDPYLRACSRVTGMEMRRPVIVEEHRDHNPEETTDRRHVEIVPRAAVGTTEEPISGGLPSGDPNPAPSSRAGLS